MQSKMFAPLDQAHAGSDANPERAGRAGVILGLVGRGIGQSKSPFFHQTEGAAHNLNLIYRLIDFDVLKLADSDLEQVLRSARMFSVDGLNVTYPFKQKILPLLDDVEEAAAAIGAVNTVVFADGKAIGYNTDFYGFLENFTRAFGASHRSVVAQIGAGGGGAATAAAMLRLGCDELRIVDTDMERAAVLVDRLSRHFPSSRILVAVSAAAALDGCEGVVNATPIGMAKHPGAPFEPSLLDEAMWVADIVYFPRNTELLRAARSIGCATLDGVGMAVLQAAAAFDLFTGLKADRERMLQRYEQSPIEAVAGAENLS
jgi:shikimate dehydrogenase